MRQALADSFPPITGTKDLTEEEERRRSRGGGAPPATEPTVPPAFISKPFIPGVTPQTPPITTPKFTGVPQSVITNVKSWVRDLASTQHQMNLIKAQISKTSSTNRVFYELDRHKVYQQLKALRALMSTLLNKQIAIYGTALSPYLS